MAGASVFSPDDAFALTLAQSSLEDAGIEYVLAGADPRSAIFFDRMLVAQAQTENLVFLTADEALAGYGPAVRVAR